MWLNTTSDGARETKWAGAGRKAGRPMRSTWMRHARERAGEVLVRDRMRARLRRARPNEGSTTDLTSQNLTQYELPIPSECNRGAFTYLTFSHGALPRVSIKRVGGGMLWDKMMWPARSSPHVRTVLSESPRPFVLHTESELCPLLKAYDRDPGIDWHPMSCCRGTGHLEVSCPCVDESAAMLTVKRSREWVRRVLGDRGREETMCIESKRRGWKIGVVSLDETWRQELSRPRAVRLVDRRSMLLALTVMPGQAIRRASKQTRWQVTTLARCRLRMGIESRHRRSTRFSSSFEYRSRPFFLYYNFVICDTPAATVLHDSYIVQYPLSNRHHEHPPIHVPQLAFDASPHIRFKPL